jgi:poly(A) polymerase
MTDTHEDQASSRAAAAGIVKRLRRAGHEALFVGGCVRDILRGVEPSDYDIVTSARPDQVLALFRRTVPVGAAFGVILVVEGGRRYEVATFRTEAEYEDGRRPARVAYATAEDDARRRDFTINGLMLDPETDGIIDHIGGRADIERRLVRTIGDPDSRFAEDHLRMLRAVRFAANLDFAIHAATLAAIRNHADAIRHISFERISDELTKILTAGAARRGMELLADTGLLVKILPEVDRLHGVLQAKRFHPEGDVWEHTLRMLAHLPMDTDGRANARLAWAIILHDVGKAVTRTEDESGVHFHGHVQKSEEIAASILQRLKFSAADTATILSLIHEHMTFMHVREMRPGRLKRLLRMPDFSLHLELHRLDCLGSHGMLDNYDYCRRKLDELTIETLHPPRLVSGVDLIAMGFTPGPRFRDILRAVEEAQLNNEIATKDEAREFLSAYVLREKK